MPAHIWIRTGEHAAAARSNAVAAAADRAYLKRSGAQGVYPQMYYSHNLHFLAVAHSQQGRFADAKRAADQLVAHVGPHVKKTPMLEVFMPTDTLILARFGRWDAILNSSPPADGLTMTRAIWQFARGLAYTVKGNLNSAEVEREAVRKVLAATPAEAPWGNSKARTVLSIAAGVLDGRIALARGEKQQAISAFRKAVAEEDTLKYNEPPDWYLSARESLGAALLIAGENQEAERVFREDLKKNPRGGRSLLGLRESLSAQGKGDAARLVQQEFDAAWQNADTKLVFADLLGGQNAPTRNAARP
jgi:hypothetical protein